jgi:hypothetical protein
MFSQDDINAELRALARAEAHARQAVETRLLRTGHINQEEIPVTPSPAEPPRWWRLRDHGMRTAVRRAWCVVVGSPW